MLYLPTDSLDPNYYFALEEYLMTLKALKEDLFMIWQTDFTVMLGNYQNAYVELNLPELEKDQVAITRRNTGGGTIFTDRGGWQFSFITPRPQGDKRHEAINFERFMQSIIQALQSLGIPAEMNSRNDLAIHGKKISGNAQCFKGDYTLHHGSLLFDSDLSAMACYLNPAKHKIISKGIKSVKDRTTNIKNYCPDDWDAKTFKDALVKEIIGEQPSYFHLSEEDEKAVQKIKQEKFESWDWVFGRNPQFSLVNEAVLAGGLLKMHCQVEKGVIQSLVFEGDFFSAHDLSEVEESLKGISFNKEAVQNHFEKYYPQDLIHNISNPKIIDTLFKNL
ncbi:lipoate--protein ligase [Facklamia sp. P13064]|uniref:lipoate--protein ligase n=1 Tax=Facklamia sp. P13064 TaxID=3421953 RepID=UPI003D1865A9